MNNLRYHSRTRGPVLALHDHAFVRAVGNRCWLIEGKRLQVRESPEAFSNQPQARARHANQLI